MIFKNREEAANALLKKLGSYKNNHTIVAGIPRGAMPMAKIIAEGLNGELTAILVHKIPHPDNEEFAIASIGLSGKIHCTQNDIYSDYILEEGKRQLTVLNERQKKYHLSNIDMKDRIVIIVDDGVATGATALAAIWEVKARDAKKIIFATAVSSSRAALEIRSLVSEFIALETSPNLTAVGLYFYDFPQVSDHEVVALLSNKKDSVATDNHFKF